MDKELIMQALKKTSILHKNSYRNGLPMDNLVQVRAALDKLDIEHNTFNLKKETIEISHKNKLLSKYTKANYPNNKFLGQSICNNKFTTEYYLNLNKVPTPKSRLFKENEYQKAVRFIDEFNESFVIKALNLRQGIGVFTNVTSKTFDYYWNKSMEIQKNVEMIILKY